MARDFIGNEGEDDGIMWGKEIVAEIHLCVSFGFASRSDLDVLGDMVA
jgi:hypothetical protein